jgi:hypothetical protein
MMNEKLLKKLDNVIINELGKAINERHADNPIEEITEDTVFERLPDLYDEVKEIEFGQETGNTCKFMPKQYKQMVMRLIAPEHSFGYKVFQGETAVTVEAFLFLNYMDEKPICTGKATVLYSSIQEMDEYEGRAYCESTAKGLAESKALQKYGIGSWFSYRFEPEENPDLAADRLNKSDGANPVVVFDKNATATASSAHVQTETQPETEKKTEKNAETPIEKAIDVSERQSPDTQNQDMTLDEALALLADCGKAAAKGLTLGETAEKFPLNLAWMYIQSTISETNKKAITIIANNRPDIKEMFEAKNIKL